MSKLLSLKSAKTLGDVARLLRFSPSGLAYVLYKTANHTKYKKFQIPKKAGGTREICAPQGAMKAAQRELATLLNECRTEIQKATPRRPLSHGFRKDLSIITNAHNHTAKRFVLNVDLADFFPTFNFGRVRGFFLKDKEFALNEKVATVVAQIACFENALPQGSPCSPVISDMIAHVIDVRLVRLAKKHRVTYSRYADDLSFSTNQKTFPDGLAKPGAQPTDPWLAGNDLVQVVVGAGFNVNPAKTRMQFKGSRQMVTGLTVNAKVNVSQLYWRSIRLMCRSLHQTGTYHLPSPKAGTPNGTPPEMIKSLDPLAGMLSHVYHVKRDSGRFPEADKPDVVYGQADHARFRFYRYFATPQRPIIICEGVTDSVYLRNAIARLPAFQPILGAKTPDGFKYAITFFSYANQVHRILSLTGGYSPILSFIHGYRKRLEDYRYKPMNFPVIILLDNDTALSPKACQALNKKSGTSIGQAATDPFFHLTDNLYLVKTPHVAGQPMSCIEDLFDAATKAMPLDGKVFHPDDDGFDKSLHIGKVPFANKVIAPNASAILWDGFIPLMDRIVAVLADHAAKVAAGP